MSSRRYIKRVWRVPVDQGAPAYLAGLVVKALVKHGWPATAKLHQFDEGFSVDHVDGNNDQLFQQAVSFAVRIVARTYRVDLTEFEQSVVINRRYEVTQSRTLREIK